MPVNHNTLMAALEATWPARRSTSCGPITLRESNGGGKRVNAAICGAETQAKDLADAETAMRKAGRPALFQITPDQEHLDAALDTMGYEKLDETDFMQIPVADAASHDLPLMSTFRSTEPLAVQREIWAETGTGPDRLAVMARVDLPRTSLMGRIEDQPAGVLFIMLSGATAMVHAMSVLPRFRGKGLGRSMITAAAHWAQEQGAQDLALAVTRENPAHGFYSALGFQAQPGYHYRQYEGEKS